MAERVRSLLEQKTAEIWALPPDATVYEAIELMAERGIGALLVVSGFRLVGIVSERDYARKVILKGRSSKETQVMEIMTSPVITVGPDYTVEDCMRIMTNSRIRHLPVMEGEQIAGIISIGDVVRSIISSQTETIVHLSNYIVGKYPA